MFNTMKRFFAYIRALIFFPFISPKTLMEIGMKKAIIKSNDLARQYIDEIFSDDYKNLYEKFLNELKNSDNVFELVDKNTFINELTAAYLEILSFAWNRACFDLRIWPQKFLPDINVVMIKDARCQKLRNEHKAYSEAIGRSGKSRLSAFKEISDTFLGRILTNPMDIKRDSTERIEAEFGALWKSMVNGFRLFELT